MIKQIVLPILAVVAFIVIVGIFVQKSMSLSSQKIVTIDGKSISVEIADTESARERGLSGRSTLEANSGMLFVFQTKDTTPTFWMKDMLISLDMIWIAGGKIIRIDKNIPPPVSGTADTQLKLYSPGKPVDYVLEVNAGLSDKNNFKVGDGVDLSKI